MCFSALLPTTQIIFLHCGPQHRKWSAFLPTQRKNYQRCCQQRGKIWISPRIRNHMRIYTRVSIRGLGWCVS
jgi:hypothetical protein